MGRLEIDEADAGSFLSRPLLYLAQQGFSRLPLGTEPLPLGPLIHPLRYDLEVRVEFFTRMAHARNRGAEEGDLVAEARASSYWTWFEHVIPRRNRSLRDATPKQMAAAFERRVRRSLALAESFDRRGFDRAFPVYLRRPERVLPTMTNKHVARSHYPVDGCHRIALLLLSGRTVLEPGEYRVERVQLLAPTDNTAVLARALPLSAAEYLSFLARGYGVPAGQPTIDALLAAIEAHHPEHLAEARGVVDADRALLDQSTSDET